MSDEFPRRVQVDKFIPAEKAIYDAVSAVEALPADPRLTKAVMLLQEARNSVADFVDGINADKAAPVEAPISDAMPPVLSFEEGDWHHIIGRGHVFGTKMPKDYEGSLIDQTVCIRGFNYVVTGVEMHAIIDRRLTKGRNVGLLVFGPRKEPNGT